MQRQDKPTSSDVQRASEKRPGFNPVCPVELARDMRRRSLYTYFQLGTSFT